MDYLKTLTAARLRELLDYEKDVGVFRWRRLDVKNQCKIGSEAGYITRKGYRMIGVDGQYYMAHRLAWLYVCGEWPPDQVDHINELKSDNRFCNLRPATQSENQQNITLARRHNIAGLRGTTRAKLRWQAEIRIGGARVYLGSFPTAEAAHLAYLEAKKVGHPFASGGP